MRFLKQILQKLKDSETVQYDSKIREDIFSQARALAKPISIICIFVWLSFAYIYDPELHPDFIMLFYYRIAFSVLAIIATVLCFLPKYQQYLHIVLYVLAGYALFACSIYTGYVFDDANYVSGLQLVIMILSVMPILFSYLLIGYSISIFLFIVSALISPVEFSGAGMELSMNNLAIAYLFGILLSFFIQKFRVKLFVQHLQLNELKTKQDGDYFLTTLLLRSFDKKPSSVEGYQIDSYLKQKKEFQFKGKDHQIGGDVIYTQALEFQQKKYLFFTNADAMGKSIQGAGGALVFSSTLEVLLERSAHLKDKEVSPTKWLVSIYKDLNQVFRKFDGSMLVSAIFGIIELDTDTMFLLNAEHPYPVLFRDGIAQFICSNGAQFKLGVNQMDDSDRRLSIHKFQFQTGDVIFIGSDGKDDIKYSQTAWRSEQINDDETLILQIVEKRMGYLDEVVDELHKEGEITDDLSLLRIEKL